MVRLAQLAYDEMNITDIPIALLSKDTSGTRELELSNERRLVCSDSKYGLPNSLAPRVVLGLMWLSKQQNSLTSPRVRFSLRDLICNYVFPNRYSDTYNPSSRILKAVEHQIHCVAATRIHDPKWYDKELRKNTPMDAAIIDYMRVIEEGGRNRARILELRWGEMFWKSLVNQYTKPIDVQLLQRINKPLDLALYRLLDRQLYSKRSQSYRSIIDFAKNKLAMNGVKLDAGGRTASSYIAKRLRQSLERLTLEGFRVRMILSESTDVFSVRFQRIDEPGPNEVVREDQAGDLVREFKAIAHPSATKKSRISESDRLVAERWIEAYGYEQAHWMVGRCVKIQQESKRQRIFSFKGLGLYEDAAASDYKQHMEREAGQLRLFIREEREKQWAVYREAMLTDAGAALTAGDLAAIEDEADREIHPSIKEGVGRGTTVKIKVRDIKLRRVGALTQEEFLTYKSDELLKQALIDRHGRNPLDASDLGQTAPASLCL